MLKNGAVHRTTLRSTSPAILTGVLFDDRGHPMTPTHSNKKGARYRYYTSHALLQGRREHAGSRTRVSAPEVEAIVVATIRSNWLDSTSNQELGDREVIKQCLATATISSDHIVLRGRQQDGADSEPQSVTFPFRPSQTRRKGIAYAPAPTGVINHATRTALLTAIARSRNWLDRVAEGTETLADIALAEHLAERHVRFLAPLAFVSPRVIDAIADGCAPAGLTVSALARTLDFSWSQQERQLSLS